MTAESGQPKGPVRGIPPLPPVVERARRRSEELRACDEPPPRRADVERFESRRVR